MNPGRQEAAEPNAVPPASDEAGSNADQSPATPDHDQSSSEPASPASPASAVASEELETVFAKGLARSEEQRAYRDAPRPQINDADRWTDLLANAPRWGKPQPAATGEARRGEATHYRPFARKSRTFSASEMEALCVIPPLPADEESRTPLVTVTAAQLPAQLPAQLVESPPAAAQPEEPSAPPSSVPPPLSAPALAAPALARDAAPMDIAPEIVIRTKDVEVTVTRESVADETMFVIAGLALPAAPGPADTARAAASPGPWQPAVSADTSPVMAAPAPDQPASPAENQTAAASEPDEPGVRFDQWAINEGGWQPPLATSAADEEALPGFVDWPTAVPAHATVPETEALTHTQVELELQAAAIKEFSTVQGYLSRVLAETINEWLVSSGTKQTRTFVLDAGLLSSSHPVAITLTMEPASADLVATLIQETVSPSPPPAGASAAPPAAKPVAGKTDSIASGFVGGVFATVEKVVDGALGALFGSKPQPSSRRPAAAPRPQKRRAEAGRPGGKLPPKKPQGLRVEVSSRHKP
ncbi:hypothetical protein CCP1ISM_10011 [Azospirillaceae bacterium]